VCLWTPGPRALARASAKVQQRPAPRTRARVLQTLFSNLSKALGGTEEARILMVGLDAAGKVSFAPW
jgi:hypothetical protein